MTVLSSSRIIVVGGSLAGQSAVTELIDSNFPGEILWITGEPAGPYSKPALSKEFMQGRCSVGELHLPAVNPGCVSLRVIRGVHCKCLDAENRCLRLQDGQELRFDGLIICTGAKARIPDFATDIGNVYSLRTLQDALEVQKALPTNPKVLVIGGGLIGCELAASLRGMGLAVTIVEMQPVLLERPFGAAFGSYFLDLQRQNGVEVVTSQNVTRLLSADRKVSGAELADGRVVPADLVLIGAGSIPETDWLSDSGLALDNGVVCDEMLSTSAPGIFAAGDVASWVNPLFGVRMRVEHWTNASAQGRAAAANLLASLSKDLNGMKAFKDVPYFWSDQYGLKIQMVGWHPGHDRVSIDHTEGAAGPIITYYQGHRLVAAAGVNASRAVMKFRRQIEEEAQLSSLSTMAPVLSHAMQG